MKQYIVFDMDGVLFDSEQLISRCWKEMGAKMGLPHIYETFLDCGAPPRRTPKPSFSAPILASPTTSSKRAAERAFSAMWTPTECP